MHSTTNQLAISLLLAVGTSHPVHHENQSIIEWTPCGLSSTNQLNNTVPILCGSLAVPLDYTDASNDATIDLPLLRIAAAGGTRKGSILLNFGGPGVNGTGPFVSLGAQLLGVVGPDHDLITWFPRGTNGPLLLDCYLNDTLRAAAAAAVPITLGNASDVADGQLWAAAQLLSDACAETQQQNGTLIGTAFTARDALQISDALDGDGLIRFWGFSYGTVVGATIAAIFPDRVDKIVIDGVINNQDYYHGLVLTSRESSDDVLMGFAQGCVETPELCPLAENRTAEQVYDFILRLINDIRSSPAVLPFPLAEGGDVAIDYLTLKSLIYEILYLPEAWPLLAQIINDVDTRNGTLIRNFVTAPAEVDGDSTYGIQCSDTFARAPTLEEAVSYLQPFRNNEFADIDDPRSLACARWPFAAKERYSGDFQVRTRNPLLVVSNTWDPATPISSGRNVSSGFEGSVLLEQRGYGHCSTAQASLCTTSRIRNYFNSGSLPEVGTVCEVDEPFFPADGGNAAWAYVLNQLAAGSETGTVITG